MVLWFILACQGPKNEAPQSVPTDVAEDTSIERDTAPPLPPGCDGVPGSEKTYDACRVCDGTAQTCDAEMVLGYVAAGTTDDNEYITWTQMTQPLGFLAIRMFIKTTVQWLALLDWGPDEWNGNHQWTHHRGDRLSEHFGELQPPHSDDEPSTLKLLMAAGIIVDRVSAVIDSENEEQVVTSTWHNPVDADAENATSTTECPVYSAQQPVVR